MFTPTGAPSRASRPTRRPQLDATDQPAVPIAGPPSYSYGSPSIGRPRPVSLQDTNKTVGAAFAAADTDAEARGSRQSSRVFDVPDIEEDAMSSASSRKASRRKTPPPEALEAMVNRRRSLRSGTTSAGRDSRSITSLDDIDESRRATQVEHVSLDYEVTQSSANRSYVEEEALLAQLERPTKESQYLEETTFIGDDDTQYLEETTCIGGDDTSVQDLHDEVDQRSILSRMIDDVHFWCFVLGRMVQQVAIGVYAASKRCASALGNLIRPRNVLLALACALALATYIFQSDLLRYLRLPSRLPAYSPPTTDPKSSEEMTTRLLDLETYLRKYSILTTDLEQRILHLDNNFDSQKQGLDTTDRKLQRSELEWNKVSQKVVVLEEALQAVKSQQASNTGNMNNLVDSVRSIKDQLAAQRAELSQYIKTGLALSETLRDVKFGRSKHDNALDDTDHEWSQSMTADDVRQIALQVIEEAMPEKLIVALDRGQPQSTAKFWQYLGTIFARKDELGPTHDWSSGPTWSEFMRSNAEEMKAFIREESLPHSQDDSAIVSKSYFMALLKEEMATIHEVLENRLSSLSHSQPGKQGNGEQSWSMRTSNVSALAVEHLVVSAIHKHSCDILGRPDYASYPSGARVNPYLTSPTYLHRPSALIPRFFSYIFFNIGSSWSHPPAVAIQPSNAVGLCWAFPGTTGQLSVKLSHAIILTDIAVEHVHPDIAHDATTAPKDLEIWAHIGVEAAEELDAESSFDTDSSSNLRHAPAAGFVHVMDITYNVYKAEQSVQTFTVPQSMRRLNAPVNQVVYRIKSNWGKEEFTCVYRVRAIGHRQLIEDRDEIAMDEDIASDMYI